VWGYVENKINVPLVPASLEEIRAWITEAIGTIDVDLIHYTGLFEMIVGVLTTCHFVLQMQPHVISFYVVTSRIRFMLLLLP